MNRLKAEESKFETRGNTIRRTAITYPDGRQLDSQYGAANGINDLLSRVESLKINGEAQNACEYTHIGLDWYVKVAYPDPEVELTYIKDGSDPVGDAGDPYTGYDRFGRTVDMLWENTGTSTVIDHIQYGYNRASNRTWRKNLAASEGQDEAYDYDGLYQLKDFARGNLNLNQDSIGAIPEAQETFSYDPTGNWTAYTRASDGSVTLDQTRVNNRDNQITQIDGSSEGIAHDAAGNTTEMPPDDTGDWDDSYTLTWDAWNRLVKVEQDTTEIAAYGYDGLYRRTTKAVSGTVRHFYYSERWKPLEERLDASTDAERQYIWGTRSEHRDELVLRDRDTSSDGTLDERLYVAMDYYNPTSVMNASGVVQERYGFTGFGVRGVMDASFDPESASSFAMDFGYKGQFLDEETGYYDYGFRFYSPQIGRWLSRDPIAEKGGFHLYLFSRNRSLNWIDRFGLEPGKDCEKDNVGDKALEIGKPKLSQLTKSGKPAKEHIEVGGEMLKALEGLSALESAGGMAKAATKGAEHLAAETITQGLPSYGTFTFDMSKAIMEQMGSFSDAMGTKEDSFMFRGGMIVIKLRCCECVCNNYLVYKTYTWKCPEWESYSYVPHASGEVFSLEGWKNGEAPFAGTQHSKPVNKITPNDVSKALSKAKDEVQCNGGE